MGRLILCRGRQAKQPYHFELTNTNIYSVEELCYYLFHNIYALNEDDFKGELVEWLALEVEMTELAEKLKVLIENQNSMKDIAATILCNTDYYEEEEIKELIHIIDEIYDLAPIRRKKIKADNYLKYKCCQAALKEYIGILNSTEAAILSEEEYGNIKHNIAVIQLHTTSYREAAETFKEAFRYNHEEESLKEYLLALKLGRCDAEFESEVLAYEVDPSLVFEINKEIEEKSCLAEESSSFKRLKNLEQLKEGGKVNEYYRELDLMIDNWKKEYRQGILN